MGSVLAILNASTVLAREVMQVIEEMEVEPFSEIRLFGAAADTFLRYRGRDIRISTKTADRFHGVRVALFGGPNEVRDGAVVLNVVSAPTGSGDVDSAAIFDPVLAPGLPANGGSIVVPRAAASMIARISRALEARRVAATVLEAGGELGPEALTELYEQTMALFAHKPLPDAVFGDRLAFNVLPGRVPLTGLDRLAGCPVLTTSLLLPLFAGTTVVLDIETAQAAVDIEDSLEDAGIEVHESIQPAAIVGESAIRAQVQKIESGRVRIVAVADEARITAASLIEVARRVMAADRPGI